MKDETQINKPYQDEYRDAHGCEYHGNWMVLDEQ